MVCSGKKSLRAPFKIPVGYLNAVLAELARAREILPREHGLEGMRRSSVLSPRELCERTGIPSGIMGTLLKRAQEERLVIRLCQVQRARKIGIWALDRAGVERILRTERVH